MDSSIPGQDCIDRKKVTQAQENNVVPQQLTEANNLLESISRRLEDCALEWQADLSRKQWKVVDSKSVSRRSWQNSVHILARTYFASKPLDEAFLSLLSRKKAFSERLKNFIALLRDQHTDTSVKSHNMQKRSFDNRQCTATEDNPIVEPLDLSMLEDQCLSERRRDGSLVNDNVIVIQNSFADVLKAKVNFDSKFVGFEAILRHASSTSSKTTQIFTMETVTKESTLKNVATKRKSRTIRKSRRRHKRLTRSTGILLRKKGRGRSAQTDQIGDQAP